MEYELTADSVDTITRTGPKEYHRHELPPKGQRRWLDYATFPFLSSKAYVSRLNLVLGWRFMIFLGVSQCLLKGMTYSTITSIMLPIFKSVLELDAKQMQLYVVLAAIPWSIKPIIGLLSDFTLIGGYHKRFWLLQSLATGMAGAGFLFLALQQKSPLFIALCFMCIQFQISLFDLMSESSYSVVMRDMPYTGSDIVTLVQGYHPIGTIIATLFVGILAQHEMYQPIFAILVVTCAAPIIPTVLGWLPEERKVGAKCVEVIAPSNWSMLLVIGFTGIAAPVTAIIANVTDPSIALAIALLFTVAACMGAYFVFPPLLFQIALYQVITSLSRPALGGAMDYFYTADATCLPSGPHFTYTYYVTISLLFGAASMLCANVIYQNLFSGMRYRNVLILTTVLTSAIGASDLFIVLRANIALGIPDKTAFLVGEAIMEPMLGMLAYIPATTLLSKVVPKGMESSAFAFLAGINNFSYMISEISGALIFDAAGVKTTAPCDFSSLWWLIIICHVTLPLIGGVGASFLIPNVYQTESLLDEKKEKEEEEEMVFSDS